jgi:trans-2,3-dihydro-3-hydroxyanthranilate isomerase
MVQEPFPLRRAGDRLYRYVVADVFTDTPLQGNPLAVFLDACGLSGESMQSAARELRLSETAFVVPAEGDGHRRIRIFTPAEELPFAGHPVLGSAFVLAELLGETTLRLETAAGVVPVELERDNRHVAFGRMEAPIPVLEPYERADELVGALGLERSELPVEAYRSGPLHVLVALPSEEAVAALRPDMGALRALGEVGVSCFAGSGLRWKTRIFAPGLGVPEDPATGSAAGPLAVHLARHGRIAFGDEIEIRQGAEIGRPSVLHARADGSAEQIDRVTVAGSAVVVARGEYALP